MSANDYIVGCGIVPVGGIDIFIGYTPEAYGMQRILSPTPLPESANNFDGSDSASSESAGSDLNFCYVAGVGSDSQPQSDDPESILPALQEDAISDAGSRSTTKVNIDSDSEEDSASMFEQQVKRCFNAQGGPTPSGVISESASTMQQAYAAGLKN